MRIRAPFILCLLLAALLCAVCGCMPFAPAAPAQTEAPVQSTPAPRILAQEPAPVPEPETTPAPTEAPAAQGPVEYREALNGLVVSEVMFSAGTVRINGEAAGFVELYNGGDAAVSLAGYYLSDSFDEPERFALPATELTPGSYLVFTLKGPEAKKETEIPFLLSEKDDGLLLSCASERLAVRYTFPERPEKDVSVSPQPDGTVQYLLYATPGKKNAAAYPTAQAREEGLLSGVYISEVSAAAEGWIELVNGGDSAVSLEGWHWTDDPDAQSAEPLSGSLEPGAYAVFRPAELRISSSGETLYLFDADGFLRDLFRTGVLTSSGSSGRSGAPGRLFYTEQTPGKSNADGSPAALTPAPVFSETGLYQQGPVTLALSCPDPDAVIFYTVDGSAPNEKSKRYEAPFTVEKSASVRAYAQSPGKEPSPVAAAHYVIGVTHALPVVCIDMEPGLFKRLTNVPYDEGGLKEQPCFVSCYEADGRLAVSFPAGVKPRGNASMSYPQKSMSLHLRARYGQKSVSYDFWNSGMTGPYEALVLRNSGQDTNSCHIRDAFAQTASKNLRVDTQLTRPVVVYVNGGYYGVLDLNENMNKAWLALHYGVDESTVNIVQRNDHVVVGSAEGFVALRKYAMTHKFTDDAVLEEFAKNIDLDAVTDYIIAQSFFGNYDIHNQNYWSTSDGKVTWRPFLYDIDRCLNSESMRSNVLSMYFNKAGIVHDRRGDRIWMDMYCALKDNPAWRAAFLDRYAYVLCNDYSAGTLLALFDSMTAAMRPEMERHAEKFGTPSSLKEWEKSVSAMRENIAGRRAVIEKNIRTVFKISAEEWAKIIAPYEKKAEAAG